MIVLKQSAAATVFIGPFVDSADGFTPETGLDAATADEVGIYKPGATDLTDISGTTTLTHRAGGIYTLTLSDTDTDTLGQGLVYLRDDSVARPVAVPVLIVPANVFDSLFATGKLQVDVTQWLGNAVTAGADDRPAVDAEAISGSTAAADNLEEGAEALVPGAVSDASATTTGFVTDLTEATNDHYNGRVLTFVNGALAGQSTDITDYNGTTKAVTVTALTEAPADTDQFVIS